MKAKVKELWLIVECPHCLRPQTIFKYVLKDTVVNLFAPRAYQCEMCDGTFMITIKGENFDD